MQEDFKPRDEHRGQQNPYVGLSHHEKDEVENAAKAADQGPTFGTPGDPPGLDPDAKEEIEQAYEDIDREAGVPRSG
jgi:hypothetical protein